MRRASVSAGERFRPTKTRRAVRQSSASRVARASTARQTAATTPHTTNEPVQRCPGSVGKTSTQRSSGLRDGERQHHREQCSPDHLPGLGHSPTQRGGSGHGHEREPASRTVMPSLAPPAPQRQRRERQRASATITAATTSRATLRARSDVGRGRHRLAGRLVEHVCRRAASSGTPTVTAVPATELPSRVAPTASRPTPLAVSTATGRHGMPVAGPSARAGSLASRRRCGRRGRCGPVG